MLKYFLMVLCVGIIVYSLPKGLKFKYEFEKGKPWMHERLIAPFDFAIEKTAEEYNTDTQKVIRNIPSYLRIDPQVQNTVKANFQQEFNELWALKYEGLRNEESNRIQNIQVASNMLNILYTRGVTNAFDHPQFNSFSEDIYWVNHTSLVRKPRKNIFSIHSATNYFSREIRNISKLDTALLFNAFQQTIKENCFYDEALNQKAIREAVRTVAKNMGMVKQGEIIIEPNTVVDHKRYTVLESLKNEYDKRLGVLGNKYIVGLGQAVLVSLMLTLLMVFLYMFRKDIFADNRKMFIILLIVTMMLVILSWALKANLPSLYFIPYCIVPIIIRVIFDTRLALYIHSLVVIIAGFFVPNGYEFIFLQMTAGMVAINSIKNLLNRSQFLISAALIYLTYMVGFIGISIVHEGSFLNIQWENSIWFLVSVTLTLLAYPLIYAFEKLFGITTEVTLMEYNNTNHPLLRELSYKAPGTFQHSLQVANLAEAAIFDIGGNALLIRVGALYHDIGKIESPQYFIENQQKGNNPHDELPYEESAKIIIRHVYAGIEMATRYQLPKEIIEFIRSHHGNTKVDYFYQSFLKNYPDRSVNENVFRYPGPIPFSKETAVLMLADSVEAASRSLKEPTALSINDLVERVIDYKIAQEQLINSDISIKEIYRIKQIFKEMLMSIYHVRIDYQEFN